MDKKFKTTLKRVKIDNMKIDKINPEVMQAGIRNGLKLKDINFTDKLIKNNFNASKTYKETHPKANYMTTRRKGHDKATNGNIIETIQEVLTSNKITKDSTIKRHNRIIDKAYDINQLSTAEKGNTRFMEMLGILDKKPETSNTFNILNLNISELEEKDIRSRLLDIISK